MGQRSVRRGPEVKGQGRPALTQGLEVERDELAAHVPEELGHVVGRVHACALGVDAAELLLVVSEVGSQGPRRVLAPSGGGAAVCLEPSAPGPSSAPVNPPPRLCSSCPFSPPLLRLGPARSPRPAQNPDRGARASGSCAGAASGVRTSAPASE